MATCDICWGVGYTSTGQYNSCNRCGGSGHGSYTDQPCSTCGGSGQSTTEVTNPCWKCGASGRIADPVPAYFPPTRPTQDPPVTKYPVSSSTSSPATKTATGNTSGSKAAKGGAQEVIGGISLIVSGILAFGSYSESSSVGEALVVGVATFLVVAVVLNVLYFAVKLAIAILKVVAGIAFWLFIALVVGNMMGFDWAAKVAAQF